MAASVRRALIRAFAVSPHGLSAPYLAMPSPRDRDEQTLAVEVTEEQGEETNPHNAGEYEHRQGTTTSKHEDILRCEQCERACHHLCYACDPGPVRLCCQCAAYCRRCRRGPFCLDHADSLEHTCLPDRPVPICPNSQEFV